MLGFSNVFQGYTTAQTNNDAPFFYGLNQSVQSFTEGVFSSFIFVGTNIRFEASLLNTIFRREQHRRNITYLTIGAFNSLRYQHNHQGNSFRTLMASCENRLPFMKNYYSKKNATGFLLGVESLRRNSAKFLQYLMRYLGKQFFTKTQKKDRLGYLHSSVGSLAFSAMGLNSFTNPQQQSTLQFNLQLPSISKSFRNRYIEPSTMQINFDTHIASITAEQYLPITSLYEREGHLMTIEGRIRKHYTAVDTSGKSFNLETILSAVCHSFGVHN